MTVYIILTPPPPRRVVGPGIGIQLSAVGNRMSVLRSVKSFETGEDDASVSKGLKAASVFRRQAPNYWCYTSTMHRSCKQ